MEDITRDKRPYSPFGGGSDAGRHQRTASPVPELCIMAAATDGGASKYKGSSFCYCYLFYYVSASSFVFGVF